MTEEDCITLSDSDEDDELEILDAKITNYGSASTQPKQLELSKDEEQKILASLRKQNMSIPEGNFKLKIYAKNGGNVDLSTLDLSSISNSSLSVKNKLSTKGKSTFIVSAPSVALHEKEESKKKSSGIAIKDLKKHSSDSMKKIALSSKGSNAHLGNAKTVGSVGERENKAAEAKVLQSDRAPIRGGSRTNSIGKAGGTCKTSKKRRGEPDDLKKKDNKAEKMVSYANTSKSVPPPSPSPAPVTSMEVQKLETFNISDSTGAGSTQENHNQLKDNEESPSLHKSMANGEPEKTIKEQMEIYSSDREASFEPRKSDEVGLIKDKSQAVKKQGVESLHKAQTVNYPCSVADKAIPVIMDPCIHAEVPSQADDDSSQARGGSPSRAVNTPLKSMEAPSLADDCHTCPALDDLNAVDARPVINDLKSNADDSKQSGRASSPHFSVKSPGVDEVPSAAVNDQSVIDPNTAVDDPSVAANDDPSPFVDDAPGARVDDAPCSGFNANQSPGVDNDPCPGFDDDPIATVDDDPNAAVHDDSSAAGDDDTDAPVTYVLSQAPSSAVDAALSTAVSSSTSVEEESSPLFDDSRLLAEDLILGEDCSNLEVDVIKTVTPQESGINSFSVDKQIIRKEILDSRTRIEDEENEKVTEERISKKRKSDGYEEQRRIRAKVPIIQSPDLFEEILDIMADCSPEEGSVIQPLDASTAPVASEGAVDVTTDCNYDGNTHESISKGETMDEKQKPIDVPNFSTISDQNFGSSPVLDDTGISKLLKGTDNNGTPLDNLDLGDEEVGEFISYEMDVDEECALDTIQNIVGTINNVSTNLNGETWEVQVVPNLEEYIERDIDNYLDTLPFDTRSDTFDDIFKAALPTNNQLKTAVADTLFEHDDMVLESVNSINTLDIGIVPTDEEALDHDFIDISTKFSDPDTSRSTLSDIEEFLKETELEGIESFVSVEVLDNLIGNNIDMNQVLRELKSEADLHFKFSGWKITHVSKKAAKIITGPDIEMAEENLVFFNENINLRKDHLLQDSFHNSENLLQEEELGVSDCLNKSLNEMTQNAEKMYGRLVPIVNDDVDDHYNEVLGNDCKEDNSVDASNDDVGKNCWEEDVEDLSVWKQRSCFVPLKNIPLSVIPESTQSLSDADIECSSTYHSSLTLLPSSGPKDFLWQLDSQEFSTMFGLCTHNQADEIRAKPSAPTAMRLRRVNQGNQVNYSVTGNARKKRDQRKSIEL